MKNLISIITVLLIILMSSGCSKEELPISKTDLVDLGSSYVELAKNTVEIPTDMHTETILSKTADALTIAKSQVTENTKVGSYLVSAFETPYQDFIMREVVSVSDNGSSVTYETIPTTVLKAYERYYINSNNTDLIIFREGGVSVKPVFELFSDQLSSLVTGSLASAGADTSNFELELKFIMDGLASFEAIHPNTAYEIFTQQSTSIDTTDINPENGVWDIAEQHFGTLDTDLEKNGLFTIRLDGFKVDDFSASIVHEVAAFENKHLDGIKKQGLDDVVSSVSALAKSPIDVSNSSEVNMKYLPTGLTVGAFSINAAIGPVIELEGNLSLFAKLEMEFPNSVNIQFGHLNWRETIPDFNTDILVTRGFENTKQSVPISSIFDDPKGSLTVGANGHIGMKFGFAVGLAGTAGEGNTAGGSIGCAIPVTLNATIDAEGAINVDDIFDFNQSNLNLSGKICTDISVEASAILFTDVNIQSDFVDNIFDVVVDFPDAVFPPQELSLLSWSNMYDADDGICAGYDDCNSISLGEISIVIDSNDLATRLAFQFDDETSKLYTLELEYDGITSELSTGYMFNTFYEANIELPNNILAGVIGADLEVHVKLEDNTCSKTFRPDISISAAVCNGTYVHNPADQNAWHKSTLSGDLISYLSYEGAQAYTGVGLLPSIDNVITKIQDSNCANTTGLAVIDHDQNNYRILNNDKVYVWIVQQPNLHNLLEITVERNPGQPLELTWETYNASLSVLAPVLK